MAPQRVSHPFELAELVQHVLFVGDLDNQTLFSLALVSRSWHEVAMDDLWRSASSLEPLVHVSRWRELNADEADWLDERQMWDILPDYDEYSTFNFTFDWEAVRRHSTRIRELDISAETSVALNRLLMTAPADLPLFPSITRARITVTGRRPWDLELLSICSGFPLSSFSLDFDMQYIRQRVSESRTYFNRSAPILGQILAQKASSLTTIGLTFADERQLADSDNPCWLVGRPLLDVLAEHFPHCSRLSSLCIPPDADIISKLGLIPTVLHCLHLNYFPARSSAFPVPRQMQMPLVVENLRLTDLRFPSPEIEAIDIFATRKLHLSASFINNGSLPKIPFLLKRLLEHETCTHLVTFQLCDDVASPTRLLGGHTRPYPQFEQFRPLLDLHNLEIISIMISLPVRTSDSDLAAAASSWPRLRNLHLGASATRLSQMRLYFSFNEPEAEPALPSLDALFSLVQRCPDLRELCVLLDLNRPSRMEYSIVSRLRSLDLGWSRLAPVGMRVKFDSIRLLFPHLASMDHISYEEFVGAPDDLYGWSSWQEFYDA